jgi:hypothetical protein
MAGQGARNRRKIQRAKERDQQRRPYGRQNLEARYAQVGGKHFYIWGETATFKSLRRSQPLGPFCYVRMASEMVFVNKTPFSEESIAAWYDEDRGMWIINHRDADPRGYYEVLFSVEPPKTQ